jgi:hypothetical protein
MMENMYKKISSLEKWDKKKMGSYAAIRRVFMDIDEAPYNVQGILIKYDRIKMTHDTKLKKKPPIP